GAVLWLAPASAPPAPSAATPAPTAVVPNSQNAPDAAASLPVVTTTGTPAPPAPGAGLDVVAEFTRVADAGDPAFEVRVEAPKTALKIGRDELRFSVRSAQEGYLYVLAHGSDGTLVQLYPNTESGAVRVKPGIALELPRPPIVFQITEPPGPGELLAIVSTRQRDLSALQPKADGPFRVIPVDARAARSAAAARAGPGGASWMAGRPVCPNDRACEDRFGAALLRVDSVR
ncbi:MAG: DUF4384 domain-containing protein, partial [Rubrivivax sp.]